ncbi:hypothetical protein GCM10009865_21260 [Aeromicrobium ponti]
MEEINSTFPIAKASQIRDVIFIDKHHAYVPFIAIVLSKEGVQKLYFEDALFVLFKGTAYKLAVVASPILL